MGPRVHAVGWVSRRRERRVDARVAWNMNPRWELQDHAWSRTWMALFAGHHEGFALESGEWLMSTFRCAANGAVRSWISQIQIPGKPGRPTSSGPAWTAVATFGQHIPPRRRPMRSSGPMDRGNATLATTPRASCLRVPQVLVCNGARDTRLDRDVALDVLPQALHRKP